MILGTVSGVRPGMRVLDVCAAPGGKTTHLAQLMENRGEIIACDIHEHRLELIKENADKLGANIIRTRLQDGCELSKNFGAEFDLVLLDAPCSGLGVLGRRADLRWNKRRGDIVARGERIAAGGENLRAAGAQHRRQICDFGLQMNRHGNAQPFKRLLFFKTLLECV